MSRMLKRILVGLVLTLSLPPALAADENINVAQKMNELRACIDIHLGDEEARERSRKSDKSKRKTMRDLIDACSVEYHAFALALPPDVSEQLKHIVRDQIKARLREMRQ